MTPEEIDQLEAGPELNTAVAEAFSELSTTWMTWDTDRNQFVDGGLTYAFARLQAESSNVRFNKERYAVYAEQQYSTDIAAAADASCAATNLLAGAHGGMGSLTVRWNPYEVRWEAKLNWSDGHRINAVAKTEALARCRVAAKAAVERGLTEATRKGRR